MTETDAGKVVRAGLLELVPKRQCNGCAERVALPGHTRMVSVGEVGVLAMFFCSQQCDTSEARQEFYTGVRLAGMASESDGATQPRGDA